MSILGQTIDYGPYGWLEGYDHGWTPNTTDSNQKRYRYGTQPQIVLWNLLQLANALYPLIEEVEPLQEVLTSYQQNEKAAYLQMMKSKLGLVQEVSDDEKLIQDLEHVLQLTETDMTIFFRQLANVTAHEAEAGLAVVSSAFYIPNEVQGKVRAQWVEWFVNYSARLQIETDTDEDRKTRMNTVNPKYVLRNYMAQLAIDEADQGKYGLIDELYKLLRKPYSEQPSSEKWYAKRPDWARNKIGCSMLSCSS